MQVQTCIKLASNLHPTCIKLVVALASASDLAHASLMPVCIGLASDSHQISKWIERCVLTASSTLPTHLPTHLPAHVPTHLPTYLYTYLLMLGFGPADTVSGLSSDEVQGAAEGGARDSGCRHACGFQPGSLRACGFVACVLAASSQVACQPVIS